jgi:Uma2 family endonuclease
MRIVGLIFGSLPPLPAPMPYTGNMSRLAPVQTNLAFEAFLEQEQQSQERHEFVDGNLFVMPGASKRHSRIISKIMQRASAIAEARGYDLFSTDTLVRTPDEIGYYPDIFLVCDPADDHPYVSRLPNLIIEVLSDSTEAIDRGEKWRSYQRIPSLERYILLSQHSIAGEVFSRQPNGWWRYESLGADALLHLPMLELALPMRDIYAGLPGNSQ